MMNKKISGIISVLFFLLMILSVNFVRNAEAGGDAFLTKLSRAKGNLQVEEIRVHTGVEIEQRWDDNIYNTSSNEKEDFINVVTPGLLISLGDKYRLEAGYALDVNTYFDYSDENYTAQTAKANFTGALPSGLNLKIGDKWNKTKDTRPEENQLRASHWTNDINASIQYKFPAEKLSLEASYTQNYLKYEQASNKTSNRQDDIYGLSLYYHFLPKTSTYISYEYGVTDYFDRSNNDNDSDSHTVKWGVKWAPTAKLSGTVEAGWKGENYKGSSIDDQSTFVLSANLAYQLPQLGKTRVRFGLNRSIEPTTYTGSTSSGISGSTSYVKTLGTIGVDHMFTSKIKGNLRLGYQNDSYNKTDSSKTDRDDDKFLADAGVSYKVNRLFSISTKYSYSNNNSNDNSRDEKHNKIFLILSAAL
jgi:hypothetical protein